MEGTNFFHVKLSKLVASLLLVNYKWYWEFSIWACADISYFRPTGKEMFLQVVLKTWKTFVQGGGCTCTLSPLFMYEVLSEKRVSCNSLEIMKRVGIFLVGVFWVRIFRGVFSRGCLMDGNFAGVEFPGGIFIEPKIT